MNVDLYTRCWNDAHMLGFMFRHYDELVDRYYVYDDGSTDGSLDILKAHPKVEIRDLSPIRNPVSRSLAGVQFFESCWKESRGRADWAIVTDIDEHLYHPRLYEYLLACKRSGITVIPALGYQMISAAFPAEGTYLCEALTMGAPWVMMNKLSIFSPDDVETTNFSVGRHKAVPEGNIVIPRREELLLLHYKYMDFELTHQRHRKCAPRQKMIDVLNSWGSKYSWSRERLSEDWDAFSERLVDVSNPDLRPWESHDDGPRWWDRYSFAKAEPQ